jgi:hypothetical protein
LQTLTVVKPTLHWWSNLFCVSALLGVGCVDAPGAPPREQDLSADYAAFDHPSATLPDASVQSIASDFALAGNPTQGTGALGLIGKLVSDSNHALANQTGFLDQFAVDGNAVARLPCTASATPPPTVSTTSLSLGDNGIESLEPSATTVIGEPAGGLLTIHVGVENSKIQRTLRGSAQGCELILPGSSALPMMTTGSADLMLDLGEDLDLGASLTMPILVQATNLRADTSSVTDAAATVAPNGDEVRVTVEGAIQMLVQPSTFGIPASGTIVVTLFTDGTIGVTDQRGTWICTRDQAPCRFAATT